ASLAIILVDARKGVIEQTCRHSFIASLLQIQHVILAVNKMDLVDYQEEVFEQIVKDYENFSSRLDIPHVDFIPISALNGDNVVDPSANMPWYKGGTLLYTLENVFIGNEFNHVDARFPVQWVIRPQSKEHHDFRGFAGRVAGGVFKKGDEVTVQPSGFRSRVKAIHTFEGEVDEAFAPMSVTMTLEDENDISRGHMLVKQNNPPLVSHDLEAMICWFSESTKLQLGRKYTIRHTTREAKCVIKEAKYKVNVNTLHKVEDDLEVGLNDIARISLRTSAPLLHDPYKRNRQTGSFIIVDDATNATVAAGMIV
ncbi:MAG: GTP-binding protein, partial [Roseibacillus sp.]|nr:GTP-binding protein [Roseibacillus sp.]